MDDRHIRMERWDDGHDVLSIGTGHHLDLRIDLWHLGPQVTAQGEERQVRGASKVTPYHPVMGVFFNGKRHRDALFDGAAQAV